MNWGIFSKQVRWSILVTLLLCGCGSPSVAAAPTPESSPEPVEEVGDVLFDGSKCTFTGPTELAPGLYSLVLRDTSGEEMNLFVDRLTDGKTYQDVVNIQSEPGEWFPEQDWFTPVAEPEIAWKKPDGGEVHTYLLNSEGAYFVGIWSWETPTTTEQVWLCAPFWVKKDSSE